MAEEEGGGKDDSLTIGVAWALCLVVERNGVLSFRASRCYMGLKLVMSFSFSNVVSLVQNSVAVRMSQQRCRMVLLKGGASSISAEVSVSVVEMTFSIAGEDFPYAVIQLIVSLVEMTFSIAGEDFPYAVIQFISTMFSLILPAEKEGFVRCGMSCCHSFISCDSWRRYAE